MDQWEVMFGTVRRILQTAPSLESSLRQIIAFARNSPALFDAPEFWDTVEEQDFSAAFLAVTDWAKQGLEALDAQSGVQFLILDLGDCPETFRLYSPGGQELIAETALQDQIAEKLFIDFEACFGSDVPDAFGQLYGEARLDLCDHHVSELSDTVLDWTDDPEADYQGVNGYLLWLMLGSLALVEPLRESVYCRHILKGRDKLYLFSGFEAIFFHVATVTPEGLAALEPLPLSEENGAQPTLEL